MGRRVPEWDDEEIRERIVGNYRLIYRVRNSQVVVIAVVHGARLLSPDIRERG